ncbi:MAG: serine/threonine-protein kinase [Labilithrix sp.]
MLTEPGFFEEEARAAQRMSRSSVPPDLVPGRRIASGKYELLRKIGVGAMGEVWTAKHLSLDEEVAIKLVLRGIHHDDGSTADGRFLVEARVARMLSRKTRHIVSVTDHGSDGDMAYLVMELLNGEPLDTRLGRSGPLELEKVVPIIKQVARGLAVAHAEGIVHRDLKPGNVFLTLNEEGHPLIKILDFGIAKLTGDRASDPPNGEGPESRIPIGVSAHEARQKTLRGFLLGTPAYMSPEQARGRKIDHRADVWALAVSTYHLLTAQYPFDGKDADELFRRLVKVQPFAITDHRRDLPAAIGDLFARAFARRIDDRFSSAEELASALEAAAGGRPFAKLSVAPPTSSPPVRLVSPEPERIAKKAESSIMAAGVPRGDRRGPIIAGVVVLALGAMALKYGYERFTRTEAPASGLAAGTRGPLETGATTLTRSDDIIPPPQPMAQIAPAVPAVPSVAVPVAAPVAPPPEPEATAEPERPPPPPPSVTAPAPKKPVDKSEVF